VTAADDIERADQIFSPAIVKAIAKRSKLPAEADLAIFAECIRIAAVFYFQSVRLRSVKKRHDELATLYSAAEKRKYEEVAALLKDLSPIGRAQIEQRAHRRKIDLPALCDLQNIERRDSACESVAKLVRLGGHWKIGRMRPSGKRSHTWQPVLLAPASPRNPPKRDSERAFIEGLQITWRVATKKEAARTASRERPGPFVRLAQECLRLIGARHADAVNLINDIERRAAKNVRKAHCHPSNGKRLPRRYGQ